MKLQFSCNLVFALKKKQLCAIDSFVFIIFVTNIMYYEI